MNRGRKKTGLYFIISSFPFNACYLLPRKNETIAPKTPINTRLKMTKPNGSFDPLLTLGVKVGTFNEGGEVNVGNLVGSNFKPKAAT